MCGKCNGCFKCFVVLLFSSSEELCVVYFLLYHSVATKKGVYKICLTSILKALRSVKHVIQMLQIFLMSCGSLTFKFRGIMRRTFLLYDSIITKKGSVKKLSNLNLKGVMLTETCDVINVQIFSIPCGTVISKFGELCKNLSCCTIQLQQTKVIYRSCLSSILKALHSVKYAM